MMQDQRSPSPSVSTAERPLRLLLAAVVLVPASIFAGAAFLSYQAHFAEAQARLARSVDILYEQSAKVFETLDLVAGRVDDLLAGLTDQEIAAREGELYARIRVITAPLEQVQFVLVIDAQGHPLVFSAMFPAVRTADYSGRDYFQAWQQGSVQPGQIFVSAVLQGRVRTDNVTFLVATQRTAAPETARDAAAGPARFRGVVAISTKPGYFVEHFGQIAGDDLDTVTLLRADGAVLARYPETVDIAARVPPSTGFMDSIAKNSERGAYETISALDNVRRLYVYRRLPHHPVYVTAGIDRATVISDWRATLVQYLLFGLPFVGGLVLLALTALRRAKGEAVAVMRLAERTRELDRVWQTSRDLFAIGGSDGMLRAANPAWGDALGFSSDEVVNRPLDSFAHPDDAALVISALGKLTGGDVVRDVDLRLCAKDSSEHWFSWTLVPEGEVFYASGRDITERRQLSDRLRQSQKMEAVGQLTGGIAHDFNNMLTVIINSLDLVTRRLGSQNADARRYVGFAMDAARRAALLTERLLAFARKQSLRPQLVDVDRLVADMAELLRGSLGSTIRLETVLASGTWRTHVDQNQLENALLNLAVNARDAMPDGGRLTIETSNVHLDERSAVGNVGLPVEHYVLITVTDNGFGMPDEVAAQAFDPFFTTKEIGKGTGLGLSQVYGFVNQSGGHVTIDSEPGRGTTVSIYLPRLHGAEEDAPKAAAVSRMPRGKPTEVVLVVDDQPTGRQVSGNALKELGYGVLEADGAGAALSLLDAHPEVILLFMDVVMPDVNGIKFIDEARRRRPNLKVLLTSGFIGNIAISNLDTELIAKPFTLEQISAKVRAVLDTTAAGHADIASETK